MPKIIEITRLIVVRLEPFLPWCLIDPQNLGEEGARGETALFHVLNTSPSNTQFPSLRYTLFGHQVTLTAYHADCPSESLPAELRFDAKTTLPLGCWEMEARHRRLFEAHPELHVPFRHDDGCRAFPLVRERRHIIPDGEGLVLVEPAGALLRPMTDLDRDLFCQAYGIS